MDRMRVNCLCKAALSAVLFSTGVLADEVPPLNRQLLDTSLELGKKFLLSNQLPDGSFRYSYNLATGELATQQSQVRQAGALWGVALIHQDQPTPTTRDCVLRGLAFFERHSRVDSDGRRWVIFPGANGGASGTVALVSLALIDFLRAEPAGSYPAMQTQLKQYLAFLASLRRQDGRFYKQYLNRSGEGVGLPSPYFDGEILLALVKAARYLGYDQLQAAAQETAQTTYRVYVDKTLQAGSDNDETKGFFQWGSMSYSELSDSGWPGTDVYAERTIQLAHWMIDVHRTLERRRNTGYAYEGIVSAYHLAESTGDNEAQEKFRRVCQQGLGKLLTWQVGSPVANEYLQKIKPAKPYSLGGVLNAADEPWLRIDVTQHQMHAVILARRYIWTGDGS
jgi:hypothetical protein